MTDQQKTKASKHLKPATRRVRGCSRGSVSRDSNQKLIRSSDEEAVSLRPLEQFVVPGLEKLNVWLAFGRPLIPALVAGQLHRERAARGRDDPWSAMVIATGWAGAIKLSHRREV